MMRDHECGIWWLDLHAIDDGRGLLMPILIHSNKAQEIQCTNRNRDRKLSSRKSKTVVGGAKKLSVQGR